MTAYFKNIGNSISTLWTGLKLTLGHIAKATHTVQNKDITSDNYFDDQDGIMTVAYPHESIPVPDNGRYRLHNEIDDCIVCDKCAKICPVDCIDIEPIKAVNTFGKTSDGTPKRIYAAKFDINMAQCCFCGLCTTVCPTECLTMTKAYDFSEYDVADHTYSFATMTPLEILTKKQELEEHEKNKAAAKTASSGVSKAARPVAKPRPVSKPKLNTSENKEPQAGKNEEVENKPKPKFKPKMKPKIKTSGEKAEKEGNENKKNQAEDTPKAKPVMKRPKPVMRPKKKSSDNDEKGDGSAD
ncbi:4Fe-4S dicluster domain-containing protein [Fulvivirga sediminis]|uniref:4Fe-4S dicluster domain-containing protein n=1 Tax=Fulvivirga sediminis TaxID=2803949 RepID=A0A937F6W2_9BACT|nr:4Fe-4S dicluster domain-containing protein [Fulvivirga sediminis]MBL3657542.1 4Fe-4S dicluster domain-containing protein [Fulvivirga sediminis]